MQRRRRLGALAIALGGSLAAWLIDGAGRASAGEPLPLRWVRALADHPVRTPLALFLLALALHPNRLPRHQEGRSDGSEAPQGSSRGR